MKHLWVVVAVACLVATTGVWAQTARSLGMGQTAVGVCDDAAAWAQNPAGLAALNLAPADGKAWANDVMGGGGRAKTDDSRDVWNVTWSGWDPAKKMGAGAGYMDVADTFKVFGAGFGMGLKDTPLSAGVSVSRFEPDGLDSVTAFDFGLLYRFEQPEKAPIRLGVVARDFTHSDGRTYDAGIAWPATDKLLIAVDCTDFSHSDGRALNAGAEFAFGMANEWRLRVGTVDNGDGHDFTAGAGYDWKSWRLDVGWEKLKAVGGEPSGNFFLVNAGFKF